MITVCPPPGLSMINILQVKMTHFSLRNFSEDLFLVGIFNVWQMRAVDETQYPSSMLWKPVVYRSEERTIEENTLMQIYSIKNHLPLEQDTDQGIYNALFVKPTVAAFNVSLGARDDGRKTSFSRILFIVIPIF